MGLSTTITLKKLSQAFIIKLVPRAIIVMLALTPLIKQSAFAKNIVIKGNKRISSDTIKDYINVSKASSIERFSSEEENMWVKLLINTQLFKEVNISETTNEIIINVTESPVINKIFFEGNELEGDSNLQKLIKIKPRDVLSEQKVKEANLQIEKYYQTVGNYNAKIVPKIIKLPYNRVNLVFEVNEGNKEYIQSINFIGNNTYSASKLKSVIKSNEYQWWNFMSNDDVYIEERLQYDKYLLETFYHNRGYIDVEVYDTIAEQNTSLKGGFNLSYHIKEGSRFSIGAITFNNEIKGFSDDVVNTLIHKYLEIQDVYDASKISKIRDTIINKANSLGFAFASVNVDIKKLSDNTTALNFVLTETTKQYIGNINIYGNTRTIDSVIRSRINFSEGDAVNPLKVRESRANINNLNFFKKVDIKEHPTNEKDRIDLDVNVQEKKTGSFVTGLGYSSLSGAFFEVSMSENNLLGTGNRLGVKFRLQKGGNSVITYFENNHFRGKNWTVGVSAFVKQSKQDKRIDSSAYSVKTVGGSLYTNYPLADHLTQGFTYNLKKTNVYDMPPNSSLYFLEQRGIKWFSGISHTLSYDMRDTPFMTSEGYYASLYNELAGLGGDIKYLKNEIQGAYYYPLDLNENTRWSIKNSIRIGYIRSLSSSGRLQSMYKYYLGGNELRGFNYGTISPRDISSNNDEVIGGEIIYNGSLSLNIPINKTSDFPILTSIFLDYGNTFKTTNPYPNHEIYESKKLRSSAGAGLLWYSPFGNLGFNAGWVISKDKYEQEKFITFNIGGQL